MLGTQHVGQAVVEQAGGLRRVGCFKLVLKLYCNIQHLNVRYGTPYCQFVCVYGVCTVSFCLHVRVSYMYECMEQSRRSLCCLARVDY